MLKNKTQLMAIIAFACIGLGCFIGGFSFLASADNDNIVVKDGGVLNLFNSEEEEESLGGTTNYDALSVDSIAVSGNGTVTGTFIATGNLSTSADFTATDEISHGGVSSDWITGTFADATTTVVAVVNPFSATVTVDKFEAYIQNGTSTIAFTCGTTTVASLEADPTDLLVDDLSIASSTVGTATTTAYVANRIGSGSRSATGGYSDAGTNSEDVILWKSGEYISCYVDTLYEGALTEATNIFSGYYRIHSRYDSNF